MRERTQDVLKHTIDAHIQTADAVGSKRLMDQFDCSSATLRKELNELMSEGYLTQLHHSSGRVPTEKGYRYYVDHCVDASKTSQVIVPAVVENLIQLHTDTKSLLVDVSQVLSTVCQTACVVVDTQIVSQTIKALHLVLLDVTRVMVVALGALGVIKEDVIELDFPMDSSDINRLSDLVSKYLSSDTNGRISELDFSFILKLFPKYTSFCEQLTERLQSLENDNSSTAHVSGLSSMLALPEFQTIDYARNLLAVLDDARFLSQVFDKHVSHSTSAMIGSLDSSEEKLKETSLIYRHTQSTASSSLALGVLGPMRMNYSFVMPLIDSVVEMIENKSLNDGENND